MDKTKILLVGCGKMGMALLEGWLKSGIKPGNITVHDPYVNAKKLQKLKVRHVSEFSSKDKFDFCVIAVKPKDFTDVLELFKHLKNCCFISIAAGQTVKKMTQILGKDAMIVRAMPNLAATIREGITGIYFNKNVPVSKQYQAEDLLGSVGIVATVDKEEKIDIVTAISGSGPAYIFHFIEAIANIAKKEGINPEACLKMAKQLVYGSGKLALESDRTPTELRSDVTSKGGTTEAALKVLMKGGRLEKLLQEAVEAAIDRAKELQ